MNFPLARRRKTVQERKAIIDFRVEGFQADEFNKIVESLIAEQDKIERIINMYV